MLRKESLDLSPRQVLFATLLLAVAIWPGTRALGVEADPYQKIREDPLLWSEIDSDDYDFTLKILFDVSGSYSFWSPTGLRELSGNDATIPIHRYSGSQLDLEIHTSEKEAPPYGRFSKQSGYRTRTGTFKGIKVRSTYFREPDKAYESNLVADFYGSGLKPRHIWIWGKYVGDGGLIPLVAVLNTFEYGYPPFIWESTETEDWPGLSGTVLNKALGKLAVFDKNIWSIKFYPEGVGAGSTFEATQSAMLKAGLIAPDWVDDSNKTGFSIVDYRFIRTLSRDWPLEIDYTFYNSALIDADFHMRWSQEVLLQTLEFLKSRLNQAFGPPSEDSLDLDRSQTTTVWDIGPHSTVRLEFDWNERPDLRLRLFLWDSPEYLAWTPPPFHPEDYKPKDIKSVKITLERTPCLGTCPVYKLTVHGDGLIEYEGERYVKEVGKRIGRVGPDKILELLQEFARARYFSMRDSYEISSIFDVPWANTSFSIDGRTKSIPHYFGDHAAPEELRHLEDRIDDIVNIKQWIGDEKFREYIWRERPVEPTNPLP